MFCTTDDLRPVGIRFKSAGRARSLAALLWVALLAPVASAETPGAAELGYVGDEVCGSCHEDALGTFNHTLHAKVLTPQGGRTEAMTHGCESCHGAGQAHVDAGGGVGVGGPDWVTFRAGVEETSVQNGVCLGCHAGGEQLYWEGSPHQNRGAACTSCHDVMKSVSVDNLLVRSNVVDTCAQCHLLRRSQTYRNAHMPMRKGQLAEGWMDCASCHNPHGTVTPKLIKAHSVNDNCYSCHADKRGPFLWEHAPVTENCTNCHEPHGSITANLLKMPIPRLCQTCHIATLHPSQPFAADDRRVFGRGCLHCHQNIHGSNHPSGAAFTR